MTTDLVDFEEFGNVVEGVEVGIGVEGIVLRYCHLQYRSEQVWGQHSYSRRRLSARKGFDVLTMNGANVECMGELGNRWVRLDIDLSCLFAPTDATLSTRRRMRRARPSTTATHLTRSPSPTRLISSRAVDDDDDHVTHFLRPISGGLEPQSLETSTFLVTDGSATI